VLYSRFLPIRIGDSFLRLVAGEPIVIQRSHCSLTTLRMVAEIVTALGLWSVFMNAAFAQRRGGESETEAAPLARVETTGAVPSDAVVIFDGKSTDLLVGPDGAPCRWPVEDGALVCETTNQRRQGGLWTKFHFQDAQIHAEVFVPVTNRRGQDAGNSGLYIHGLFELQVLDSYENRVGPLHGIGAIYNIHPPLVSAARPPGNWNTYEIVYRAPKRDAAGEPVAEGSITAFLNGVLVHDRSPILRHVSVYAPTYAQRNDYSRSIQASLLKTGAGPLQLQDHDGPVRFRNIWIRPLDKNTFMFPKSNEEKGEARKQAPSKGD
jgi:hypothetical protein